MAGIGFEPKRLRRHDTLSGTRSALGVITSGPWIISIISIAILGTLLETILASREQQLIQSSLTCIYAFMLILTGASSLTVTRFVADAILDKRPEKILPSYLGSLTATCSLAALVAGAFVIFGITASPFFQLAAIGLSILVAAIFITANYLGALKHYGPILASLFTGYTLSGGLACLLAHQHPLEPAFALAGLVVGHLVLFIMLFAALHRELPPSRSIIDFACFRYFLRFPALALCGLFWTAGLWIDKLLFWLSPENTQVNGAISTAPDYNAAVYLAVLSIVPGIAVFCFKLETGFAEHFTKYFKSLNGTGTLATLQDRRDRITKALREGFLLLARVQGVTTAILLIFTEKLTGVLHLGAVPVGIVRVALLGTCFLVLFLALLTILFHCNDHRGALAATGGFLATNTGITLASLLSGQAYYGIGFAVASCFAAAFTAMRANHLLAGLEFRIVTTDHTESIDKVPNTVPAIPRQTG